MSYQHLTDRELSWLSFDQRVLELAEDSGIPLLERLRFLAISSSNLDEFFMVRVATLMSKIEKNLTAPNVAGIKPLELLKLQTNLYQSDLHLSRQYRKFLDHRLS